MTLTRAEFDRGVEYWFRVGWPRDFHLSFYEEMAAANPGGAFDDAWWDGFLPVLRAWRATRPRGSDYLTERARARFTGLSRAWASAVQPHLGSDIASAQWRDLAPFPAIVAEVKNLTPPTFTAKFCHFLAPALFPVVDGAAMGSPFSTYAACFNAYQREWLRTDERIRQEPTLRLRELVGESITAAFPMKNKIVELCLIGRNQGQRGSERAVRAASPGMQEGRLSREEATTLVKAAIDRLVAEQPELLELDVSERALSHHLAVYLGESAPTGLQVDVEYNRRVDEPKRLNLPSRRASDSELHATTVFPDIVIHRRGSDQSNLVVLEVKKRDGSLEYDHDKLVAFRDELGYAHAGHVVLGRDGRGQLVNRLQWVDD